ncbi:MAG: guanylate kinase [Phycisphaerales bacterium]
MTAVRPDCGTDAGSPGSSGEGLLLVMSGPSGVGKTTIVHELVRRFGGVFSVSATTRSPGPGERDGVDYYFLDQPTFQRWIDEDRFLEHAQVFGRSWYGTPEEPVRRQLAQGRLVVLDIDVQGAENVRRKIPQALGVFVLPPSEEELLKRLRARGREDDAAIERRFAESKREIARAQSASTYHAFVVNDDLRRATEEIAGIVAARLAGAGVARAPTPRPDPR